jgi:hypothetical protein
MVELEVQEAAEEEQCRLLELEAQELQDKEILEVMELHRLVLLILLAVAAVVVPVVVEQMGLAPMAVREEVQVLIL